MKKNKILAVLMVLLFFAVTAYAEKPHDMTGMKNGLWIAPQTDTAPAGIGAGDLYLEGTIYNEVERTFTLPLIGAFIVGTGVMGNDGSTTPGMATVDSIPAIVYADSGETAHCQWTFRLPDNYSSGLGFRVLMSSSSSTFPASHSIDWQFFVNEDGVAFDAAAIAQDAVSPTEAGLAETNEVVTLVLDATGIAALTAAGTGAFLTIDIWNAGLTDNTTEIKGIQGYYTSTK